MEFDPPCPITVPSPVNEESIGKDDKKSGGRIILELGSGTGYNGIRIVEALKKRSFTLGTIILTDLPEVVPLLESTLARHNHSASDQDQDPNIRILIRPLSWGSAEHVQAIANELRLFTESDGDLGSLTIVCSDLVSFLNLIMRINSVDSLQVYFPELLAPLLRSLIHITSIVPSSKIIISCKHRSNRQSLV